MRLAAFIGCFFLLVITPVRADDEHPQPFDGNYDAMAVVDAGGGGGGSARGPSPHSKAS